MKVGIIGGGIMGISLGYYLAKKGAQVHIFEASPTLGGLAGPLPLEDGTEVDRFYHAILSSDSQLRALCEELAIDDRMRFMGTKMGFYFDRKIHPMNGMLDFFRFPPLGWIDRFRLGLTILAAQRVRDWRELETESVESWLMRWSGRNAYQNIWRPMLKAKFDGAFDTVPATWIWSRLVRMKSTRKGADQKEQAGHLIGGYATLLRAMAERIRGWGGEISLSTPVEQVAAEDGVVHGLRVHGHVLPFDTVIGTMQAPIFSRLVAQSDPEYSRKLLKQEYLGVICPLMVMDRPLSGYWTLNITDDSIPFTGVIETTSYIDPKYVGGHHLVYLPKYTQPGSEWVHKSDEEIKSIWMTNLAKMFPDFDTSAVRYFIVNRERYVEPLHMIGDPVNGADVHTPIANLYLVTTAQIYPALTNGESVARHAEKACATILATKSVPVKTLVPAAVAV